MALHQGNQQYTGTITAPNMEGTTGDIFLRVASGGSDAATIARPARILSGDFTATPFLTIQAALDTVPKILRSNLQIKLDVGDWDGAIGAGFTGDLKRPIVTNGAFPSIRFVGDWALATLTTGVNTGTAGTGTGGITIKKPAAAADWTVNNLRGKFVRIVSGAGSPTSVTATDYQQNIALIRSNTIDTITTYGQQALPATTTLAAIDNTSVFEIVTPSASIHAMNDANAASFGFSGTGGRTCLALLGITLDINCHSIRLGGTGSVASTAMGVYFAGPGLFNAAYCFGDGISGGLNVGPIIVFFGQNAANFRADQCSFMLGGGAIAPYTAGSCDFAKVASCVLENIGNGVIFSMCRFGRTQNLEIGSAFPAPGGNANNNHTISASQCMEYQEQGTAVLSGTGTEAYSINDCPLVDIGNVTGTYTPTNLIRIGGACKAILRSGITVTGQTNDMLINGLQTASFAQLDAAPDVSIQYRSTSIVRS